MLGELLDKLTSYNIFNNLLPGAVFAFAADRYFKAGLLPDDLLIAGFLYYFLGVVISRFGSLTIEPVFRWVGFVKFESYSAFISASAKDAKIDTLMESANMYRTFVAMFALLLLFGLYSFIEANFPWLGQFRGLIACAVLGLVFLLSYIKQANYVASRVRESNARV
jgi:hypothetical protein